MLVEDKMHVEQHLLNKLFYCCSITLNILCLSVTDFYVRDTECVHPVSRMKNGKPQVVNPSDPHISSGSTVNTCLSQGSLIEDLYDIIMDDIQEEEESDNDDDSGSSTSS